MRARVVAQTSLFYGEEGEVLRQSRGPSFAGESVFIIHLDRNSGSSAGDPLALPFSADEIVLIYSEPGEADDTVDAHYSSLERLEEGL